MARTSDWNDIAEEQPGPKSVYKAILSYRAAPDDLIDRHMNEKGNIYDEFEWRGLLYDSTPGLKEVLAKKSVTAYIGFDPTASSLHVGSLLPIMGLARLQKFGHTPIALVGGATGMIGDPSGKSAERQLLTEDIIQENLEGIRSQLAHFLDFESKSNPAQIVNNLDWLGKMHMIDFLRDTGKHFRINYMLAKESVKRRIQSEDGISYTEFTYMMLQAYDFLELNRTNNCTLQMGGSDQWGNILAGADLVRRVNGKKVHGLVFPLVTNSAGTKFGKTEAGTVWLDPDRTSPYRFYQFWLNTDDRDVIHYLKAFTWLTRDEIAGLEQELADQPGGRAAQRGLARIVTEMLHGESELQKAELASKVLFGGSMQALGATELKDIFEDVPSTVLSEQEFAGEGMGVLDLCRATKLTASNGEARRLIRQGGLFLNNSRSEDENRRITRADFIEKELIVLRKGKRNFHLVQITPGGKF